MKCEAPVSTVRASAYSIPTDKPEADGTLAWDKTTLVLVEIEAGGKTGIGYTYSHHSNAALINDTLAAAVHGTDAMDVPAAHRRLRSAVRNLGQAGLSATALSAVDCALWDLKAKLLELPLCRLLGKNRDTIAIYGSGGFTTYSDAELKQQLGGWAHQDGCRWVKMKIGSDPARDPERVAAARRAIGERCGLFVDANGAFDRKQAVGIARLFAREGVAWFEEPVSSDDLAGLALLRRELSAPMEVAAGEYGYTPDYFRCMLEAGAVDVQQADVTRCGGITGWLRIAALCDAYHTDLSGHCAPALHLHAACAVPRFRHLEWFHDHVRIEQMLFEGAPVPRDGAIRPDLARPGIGLDFRRQDAERFRAC